MENYYFIINPLASSGKAAVVWRDCKHYLDRHHVEYEAFMTSHVGHATALAEGLTCGNERMKEKTIVVIGGDGTFGEVVSGINISALVTLAFIPAGSGNDFAGSMRLSKRPVRRLKHILKRKKIEWLDYGVISYIQGEGELSQRRFVVSGGLGLDAAICEEVQKNTLKTILNRMHLGRLVYIGAGLRRIFREQPFSVTVLLDGVQTVHYDSVRFISVHIQPREGGGFRFAPKADCEDGIFELCIVNSKHSLSLIKVLIRGLFGRHVGRRGVHIVQCVTASFRTDRKICVHTDGEICGHLTDFNVLCEKRKLKMIL